jgi:flagellar hook protein FlgE
MGAQATGASIFEGNLPYSAATGTTLNRQVDIFDGTGAPHSMNLAFSRVTGGTGGDWTVTATVAGTASVPSTTTVSFKTDGTLAAPAPTLTILGDNAVGTKDITIDLKALTSFAGLETVAAASQNGRAAGGLQSFAINSDGTLLGSFSNGLKQSIGRVALGNFGNPSGLEKSGSSLYRPTVNSGDAQVGAAGSGGRGVLSGGSLEMSNVDLSAEFTNLIVAQRGFQANSRVITTSDEVLQELVNLKR